MSSYDDAISYKVRQTKAEISFGLEDVTAKQDCTGSFSAQTPFSNGTQILDDNRNKNVKIATFEKKFWKLDGTFITRGEKDISESEVGFVSSAMSNNSNTFSSLPTIELTFTETHSSVGLTMYFDSLTNNYATRMEIIFYNGNTVLSDEVVDNSELIFVYENRVENYNKIEIIFMRTSKPKRRVRLVEIDFGIVRKYKDEQIVSCKLTREVNLFNETIPNQQLTVEIDNQSKEFNLINPSGIYAYLQQRQSVSAKIGVVLPNNTVEYVEMGKYYLDDWNTKDLVATLKASDKLKFYENLKYSNTTSQTKTLRNFAIEILNFAGLSNYSLDSSLSSITVTTTIPENNIKELLKQIAIAANCILYVDKNDIICIKKIVTSKTSDILLDNMYKVPEISLDEVVKSVTINYKNNASYTASNNEDGVDKSITSIFVDTSARAQVVAEYLLNLYQNRIKYAVDWRQNPKIDINNKVMVEDTFGENGNIIVTKQEFSYSGYLQGRTDGRGA